jgi:hypothetical protein
MNSVYFPVDQPMVVLFPFEQCSKPVYPYQCPIIFHHISSTSHHYTPIILLLYMLNLGDAKITPLQQINTDLEHSQFGCMLVGGMLISTHSLSLTLCHLFSQSCPAVSGRPMHGHRDRSGKVHRKSFKPTRRMQKQM